MTADPVGSPVRRRPWGPAVGTALALLGFLLPWVTLEVRDPDLTRSLQRLGASDRRLQEVVEQLGRVTVSVSRGGRQVTGEVSEILQLPRRVSGWQIPGLAAGERAQLAIVLAEMLTGDRYHVRLTSYAVYLVPGLALLAGWLLWRWRGRRPLALGVGSASALVVLIGGWKLLSVRPDGPIVTTIGPGLWLSWLAYAALAGAAFIDIRSRRSL